MITLHHCVSVLSFRPLWMLEELGIPYQLRMLPFPPRVLAREYLQDKPLGPVPLLCDGDIRMTESAAMCQYLAARYSPNEFDVPVNDPAYGSLPFIVNPNIPTDVQVNLSLDIIDTQPENNYEGVYKPTVSLAIKGLPDGASVNFQRLRAKRTQILQKMAGAAEYNLSSLIHI